MVSRSQLLPDVKIAQLRCFAAVVEEQGFKPAALRLFRSQPAVSIAVKELEKMLGAPLFEKGTSSQPTPYGVEFYNVASKLLTEYDRALQWALEASSGHKGAIRLASVPSLAREVLPHVIAAFATTHPEIRLHVSDGHTEFVRDAVLSGEADFGFCGNIAPDARLAFQEVFQDRMGVICNKDHPWAGTDHVAWRNLKTQRVIGNGTMRLIDDRARRYLPSLDQLFLTNTTSLLAVVRAGVGITVLPRLAFPSDAGDELDYVPLSDPVATRSLGLLRPAQRSLTPAAQIFQEEVVEALKRVQL